MDAPISFRTAWLLAAVLTAGAVVVGEAKALRPVFRAVTEAIHPPVSPAPAPVAVTAGVRA